MRKYICSVMVGFAMLAFSAAPAAAATDVDPLPCPLLYPWCE